MQRGKRADGRVKRGNPVDYRWPASHRRLVFGAGVEHHPGHRLADRVKRTTIPIRAILAEARDVDHDDAGIKLFQDIVTQPHRIHHAGAEVLHQHVGLRHQLLEDGLAARASQVEGDALFAAIVLRPIDYPQPARLVAIRGGLDLDHLRTQIPKDHGASRTRLVSSEIDYPDTIETASHFALLLSDKPRHCDRHVTP